MNMIRNFFRKFSAGKMLLAASLLFVSASAQAQTPAEAKAQKSIIEYLRSKQYAPSIDTKDQSINFKSNGELYWITIKGEGQTLLYTLHRKGLKLSGTPGEVSRKRENAQIATNDINAHSRAKTYVSKDQVYFTFPMYAESPESFCKCIKSGIRDLSTVRDEFMKHYKEAGKETKARHDRWYNMDTSVVVIEQPKDNLTQDINNLKVTGFSLKIVDAKGNTISDYDQSIRRASCQFIQPMIDVSSSNKGLFKVETKIYTPKGKLLVPDKDTPYTTITYIKIDKKNKIEKEELNKFGASDPTKWAPGEYRIEFWEDNNLLFKGTFNIL